MSGGTPPTTTKQQRRSLSPNNTSETSIRKLLFPPMVVSSPSSPQSSSNAAAVVVDFKKSTENTELEHTGSDTKSQPSAISYSMEPTELTEPTRVTEAYVHNMLLFLETLRPSSSSIPDDSSNPSNKEDVPPSSAPSPPSKSAPPPPPPTTTATTPTTTTPVLVSTASRRPVILTREHLVQFCQQQRPVDAFCEVCCETAGVWEDVEDDGFTWIEMALSRICTGDEDLLTVPRVQQLLREWHENFPQVHVTQWAERLGIEQQESDDWPITCRRLQRLLARHRWCQTLCRCDPSRWLHNCCLEEKLNIGINGLKHYLLQCGFCRSNVWGAVSVWLLQAVQLLNEANGAPHEQRLGLAEQAYELALDATNAVVQQGGGGYVDNAVLGECLTTVGAAIYHRECAVGGYGSDYPTTLRSGWVSLTALRLGAPAKLFTSWLLSDMRWVCDENEEGTESMEGTEGTGGTEGTEGKNKGNTGKEGTTIKVQWLDRATRCCELSKRSIPNGSTELAMRTECMLLEFYAKYPTRMYNEVMSVVKAWPWKLEEWNAATCFSVCSILQNGFGVRYMKEEYLDRGVDLDESLFGELVNEWNGAREEDVKDWNNELRKEVKNKGRSSDEKCVSIADEWWWDKRCLEPEVQGRISQAYKNMGRKEEMKAWLPGVDN